MMVLWVFVLLSIIALNFLSSVRWHVASTRNLREETTAYYLALSGYHEALMYLMADKDLSFDFEDNEGNFWVDLETPRVTGISARPEGELKIKITDEGSKININLASIDQLRRLFQFAGIPDQEIPALIDSVMDWKDLGNEHHLQGAESDYYEGLEEPYPAKNAFFDVPEELALVKGMKPEYIKGSEGQKLLDVMTTFGRGILNINAVTPQTMQMLGLNEFEVEAILKQRSPEVGGFRIIPQQFSIYGLRTVSSSVFRIEVTARATDSGLASKIIGIVQRASTPEGFKFTTEYWRESAEISRS